MGGYTWGGGFPGGNGQGGGLFVVGGTLTIDNSTIAANTVVGGPNGGVSANGGSSQGGGVYARDATVTVSDSSVAHNQATGADGGTGYSVPGSVAQPGSGGNAQGGGLYTSSGTLTIRHSTLANNQATGGLGGIIQGGTRLYDAGGDAEAGGLYASGGLFTFMDSTAAGNSLHGGDAIYLGSGGASQGGGIYVDSGTLIVNNSTIAANTLRGGQGGEAGIAQGGGLYVRGTCTLSDSTVSGNVLRGGDGSGHAGGAGQGGGLWVPAGATVQIHFSSVAANQVTGGTHGLVGSDGPATGGGFYNQGMVQTDHTILAGNTVTGAGTNTSPDLFGILGSRGYNLIGNSQGGGGFDPSDLLDVDPLLSPLQDNGGPTQTMALLPGSPALNAGDPNQLGTTDQRGVVRTGGVNIGAYQASASALVFTAPATVQAGVPFTITVQAVDPFGQTAVGYTGTVHFAASNGAMANYAFTPTDGGQHTFNNLVLRLAGTLTVTGTDTADGSVTGSTSFTVTPAAADHLVFLAPPSDTVAGQTISPAVMVAVVDQFGNIETGDNSDTVTLSLGTNPGGGTLSGTLTVTVVEGIATFSDLSIDQAGVGYTLHATVGGSLADIDSNPFNITM
jgi:hypothetical protein